MPRRVKIHAAALALGENDVGRAIDARREGVHDRQARSLAAGEQGREQSDPRQY
jgi:hypothetical protein